jgi:hypothetical protein
LLTVKARARLVLGDFGGERGRQCSGRDENRRIYVILGSCWNGVHA